MKMHMSSSIPGIRRPLAALATPEVPPLRLTSNTLNSQEKKQGQSVAKSIRWHLVARIKKEIAAGTYDTDAKLDLAMRCFLDQCGS